MSGTYSTGLCDCFSDGEVCLLGTFLPCYLAARTIGRFKEPGEGVDWFWLINSFCCNLTVCAIWEARTRVQEKYDIRQGLGDRCLMWCCCPSLQLCQDARELNVRRPRFIRLEDSASAAPPPQAWQTPEPSAPQYDQAWQVPPSSRKDMSRDGVPLL